MIEPPLPFGDAAARWFYVLLKGLKERGHKVVSFVSYGCDEDIEKTRKYFPELEYEIYFYHYSNMRGLRKIIERVFSYRNFSEEFRAHLSQVKASGYDVLHLEQLWSAWVGLDAPHKSVVNVHHLESIDLEFVKTNGLKDFIKRKVLFKTEKRLIKKMTYIRSNSPRLVEPMQRWNPKSLIKVIPVGIDSSFYEFIPDKKRTNSKTLSMIGTLSWYPSQSAALRLINRLWPKIKERVPDARLQIVGWSARSVLKDYLDLVDVEILENVPEIQPYFENANVFLYAPARGSGMKIKILEAMGWGIPIVTTSEGSEGLPAQDQVHMGICEDDDGLIERAVKALNSVDVQNSWRHAARILLEQHCGPNPTVDAMEEVYSQIVKANDGI